MHQECDKPANYTEFFGIISPDRVLCGNPWDFPCCSLLYSRNPCRSTTSTMSNPEKQKRAGLRPPAFAFCPFSARPELGLKGSGMLRGLTVCVSRSPERSGGESAARCVGRRWLLSSVRLTQQNALGKHPNNGRGKA